MYAETLEMNRIGQEEKKREYYSTILQETERLTRLVNNILDFSKMEAGKKQYNMQEADLNEIVSALLETYAFHLQSEGFETMIQLQSPLPPFLADKESISEAIANILDNAIKYSDANKFIRITTDTTEKILFLEIEDHGIGITQEHHKKIFENFYRVSSGLVHNVKGSGLGLALVKHIVESHNGKVLLTSAVGKGSTFRLEFPVMTKQ
jgi:two-component system phosphate regulon sensor histidine kinase PhoR